MANYNPEGGAPMGEVITNIFGKCENKDECSLEKWVKSDSSYEKFYAKHKDDEAIESIVRGVLLYESDTKQEKKGSKHNIAFFRYVDEAKNEKKAKYDRFTVNDDLSEGGDFSITDGLSLETKIVRV